MYFSCIIIFPFHLWCLTLHSMTNQSHDPIILDLWKHLWSFNVIKTFVVDVEFNLLRPGPHFNKKTVFPRYADSHVKDKTVARPYYLNIWIPVLVSLRWHFYIETVPLVTHASVNWVIIGSGNGFLPVQYLATTWANAGSLWIKPLGTTFSEVFNQNTSIRTFDNAVLDNYKTHKHIFMETNSPWQELNY